MAAEASRLGALVGLALLLGGCFQQPLFGPRPTASPEPEPSSLPPLPIEQIAPQPSAARPIAIARDNPLARFPPGETVTLSAVDVDVRALLPALAEAADLSLVMGPEVQGRVTVNLVDVPALEALEVVLTEADLMIAEAPVVAPWGPAVFYTLPVNVWTAGEELIRIRYRVSEEMARWIVETQLR